MKCFLGQSWIEVAGRRAMYMSNTRPVVRQEASKLQLACATSSVHSLQPTNDIKSPTSVTKSKKIAVFISKLPTESADIAKSYQLNSEGLITSAAVKREIGVQLILLSRLL